MNIRRDSLTLLDGTITGLAALPAEDTGKPVLVYLHGGGASAKSVDIPGNSQIDRAALNGFTAYALDRPGYGGSEPLDFPPDAESGVMKANAERLYLAIAELWERHAATAPGIVIVGISIGSAISLHLSALWSDLADPRWPLLGLAIADVAQQPPQDTVSTWHASAVVDRVDMGQYRAQLPQPPLWTLAPYLFEVFAMPGVLEPALRSELLEVVSGWPREWEKIAAAVRVPVHYRLGQFDTLWVVSEELVGQFAAALRTRSSYVDAAIFPGGAHGIADSIAGKEYCFQVLGFAERCAAAATTPQLLGE